MRFDLTTRATPAQVLAAFTDFTDRRPEIWDRTLDPKTYEVREAGDTWAVARESTRRSPYWVALRYDWSDPTAIRWTEFENSYGGHGGGSLRIVPREDGSSLLHAEWWATPAPPTRDRVLLFLLHHTMNHVVARLWRTALDRYARTGPA